MDGRDTWQAGNANIVSGSGSLNPEGAEFEVQEHAKELAAMLQMVGMGHVKVCVDDPNDGGESAASHLLALYKEAPPVGVTLVVTSTTTLASEFAKRHPVMFRERTVRIVHMGGAIVENERNDGGSVHGDSEPSGADGGAVRLQPDPAAQNNRLDMDAATALYERAQELSVPMTIGSRFLAHACRIPPALFDLLDRWGGELGKTLKDEQVEAINELWTRACATNPRSRRGLPARCNREWFEDMFCKGAQVGDESVWSLT